MLNALLSALPVGALLAMLQKGARLRRGSTWGRLVICGKPVVKERPDEPEVEAARNPKMPLA
jgi:hypothetical protein